MPKSSLSEFDWKCQPQAAMRIDQWTEEFVRDNRFVANLQTRMLEETGTRLHFAAVFRGNRIAAVAIRFPITT